MSSTLTNSFTLTPGKGLKEIGFNSYKVNEQEVEYTLYYEEAPLLSNGFVVKFETNNETLYACIVRDWFEGAYSLPSFTCAYVYNVTTDTFYTSEKTYRFKNIDIKAVQTSDDTIEDVVKEYNNFLKNQGKCYYPGIHRVENSEERKTEYWYTYFDKHTREFNFDKAKDENSAEDNQRYYITHNYYSTSTEAAQKAKELNKLINR